MAESTAAIARLVDCFADLPGIGRESAERLAYHVLRMPQATRRSRSPMPSARSRRSCIPARPASTSTEHDECEICTRPAPGPHGQLCVVEQVRDLRDRAGGVVPRALPCAPGADCRRLEGEGPEKLTIDRARRRG